jgi:predicted polyphosphate/ATP-dependent NAD kinase
MSAHPPKVGLIVNPVAGIGGVVGLKGSDGADTQEKALALGAVPRSLARASRALERLVRIKDKFDLVTCGGRMGLEATRSAGLAASVITEPGEVTTGDDTRAAARAMAGQGVDLLLFAGGDGTARDIHDAVGDSLSVLGIPTGVKIYSGVFAVSPAAAGELAADFLQGKTQETRDAEVMDIDEASLRQGRVSAQLYGYLRIPRQRRLTQGVKASSDAGEAVAAAVAAATVVRTMKAGRYYVIGPGTTTRAVMSKLGLEGTLVGVDVVRDGMLEARDVGEQQILDLVAGQDASVVVTVIGGQGYLFGRGNQQISAKVIREVGKDNIIVVATRAKLNSLQWRPLLVDTGDDEVDVILSGYIRVVTGHDEQAVCKVGGSELRCRSDGSDPFDATSGGEKHGE